MDDKRKSNISFLFGVACDTGSRCAQDGMDVSMGASDISVVGLETSATDCILPGKDDLHVTIIYRFNGDIVTM